MAGEPFAQRHDVDFRRERQHGVAEPAIELERLQRVGRARQIDFVECHQRGYSRVLGGGQAAVEQIAVERRATASTITICVTLAAISFSRWTSER